MPRLTLGGGAYSAPSFIANAQRCVNLFPEETPKEYGPPVPLTHYFRPGLTLLKQPPLAAPGRGLFTMSNGNLYAVIGPNVYFIDPNFNFNLLGQLQNQFNTPVSMVDNGLLAILVDGSSSISNNQSGNIIDIFKNVMSIITDPNFLGGTRADFLDGFIVLNEPGSPNWYSTLLQQLIFNALDFGTKTAWPDNVLTLVAVEREVWLFGPFRSEIWANAGTVPFAFNVLQGVIIEHGCGAIYSPAAIDTSVYWLNQTREGARMIMKSDQHVAKRISTHAIEAELLKYVRVDDAIGCTYQYRGHNFYDLHFPTADRTWSYDASTNQWHEKAFYDPNGVQHRHRVAFVVEAYGQLVGLDWQNGNLYLLDQNNFTDNGVPIVAIRSFPHAIDDDFTRQTIWRVMADIESGQYQGVGGVPIAVGPWSPGWSNGFGPNAKQYPPNVSLRVSWDRGESFGNYIMQPLGRTGQANAVIQWNRLGYGRDAVIEISYAPGVRSALNGAWVVIELHEDDKVS